MLKELDPLLHSQLRLGVMSLLMEGFSNMKGSYIIDLVKIFRPYWQFH